MAAQEASPTSWPQKTDRRAHSSVRAIIALVTGASRAGKELLPGRLNIRGATRQEALPTYNSDVLYC